MAAEIILVGLLLLFFWFVFITSPMYLNWKLKQKSRDKEKKFIPAPIPAPEPIKKRLSTPLSLCQRHTLHLSRMGRITVVVDAKNCEICKIDS